MTDRPPTPRLLCTYLGNRWPHHFERDLTELHEHGFNAVCHPVSEHDLEYSAGQVAELIRLSRQAGFEVWCDPLCLGNLFGLGDYSGYLQRGGTRRITSDGDSQDKACLSDSAFYRLLIRWLSFVASSGAHGVLWDEPDLSPCRCGRCSPDAMWTLLRGMSALGVALGLESAVCLHCMAWDDHRDRDRIRKVCHLPDVAELSLSMVPGSYAASWEDADLMAYHEPWFRVATQMARQYGKRLSVWPQGYSIAAGREHSVQLTIDLAHRCGIDDISYWGFRGLTGTYAACDDPVTAWRNAGETFNALSRPETDGTVTDGRPTTLQTGRRGEGDCAQPRTHLASRGTTRL